MMAQPARLQGELTRAKLDPRDAQQLFQAFFEVTVLLSPDQALGKSLCIASRFDEVTSSHEEPQGVSPSQESVHEWIP